MTIPGLALKAAQQWPDAKAIVDGDVCISFSEMVAKMRALAAVFIAPSLRAEERVAL